jgi:hypothetical protein
MLFDLRLSMYSANKTKKGKEQISVLARRFMKEFSSPVYGVV